MLEKNIKRKIMKHLAQIPKCRAIPYPATMMSGEPDIIGCLEGHMFVFEVKTEEGRTTPLQARRIEEWKAAGAVSGVVRSIEDVEELLGLYHGE